MTTQFARKKWRSLGTLWSTGTLGALTDPELLECFRSDRGGAGQEAFRILVERHGPMVLGLCRSLIPNTHDADDAFQATFLVLVRKGHAIWVRDSVGPWLYGVAGRVARRARRRALQQRRREVPLGDDIAQASSRGWPVSSQDTVAAIHKAIADLPASLRAPIVLCALEGLSYDAAARQLGVPEPTLRGRIHRARRRLESQLRDRGIASALPVTAIEPLRLVVPPLPPALVQSTIQHATWWSSISGLVAGEAAIPASIAALARGVLRSMLVSTSTLFGFAAILIAGILGTVVLAQQTKVPPTRAARQDARPQDKPATAAPATQAPASRPLLQQFQALVAGHEENQKKMQTLKCVIEERVSFDSGKTWRDLVTWKVWKSGPRERAHFTTHRVLRGGETFEVLKPPRGEMDALFGPDGIRSMAGYNPANPPVEPVTALDELLTKNRIGGLIRPPQPVSVGGYRTGLAPDYLLGTLLDAMYSLRDLCEEEANATSKPVNHRDEEGHMLIDLQLKAPLGHAAWDVRHEMPEGKYYSYVVTLSPRHGNAIIESDRLTRVEKGTGKPVLEVRDRNQVIEFQEPAPGVFLAKRIRRKRTRSDAPDEPNFILETVIHDVQVNGPITDKELAFRFPRGIGVGDVTKDVFYVWGDGAPEMTLTTQQYNDWRSEEMLKAQAQVGK
jgi:RNA polymerase sigma factor (sigma-70 family)